MSSLNEKQLQHDLNRLKTMIVVFRNHLVLAFHFHDRSRINEVGRYYKRILDRFGDLEDTLSEQYLSNRYCLELIQWRNYVATVILKMKRRYGEELPCR